MVGAVVFHSPILRGLGSYLIRDEGPRRADAALVLAGDSYGHRIVSAAELARQGYVPKVYVSGPSGMYGKYECDLAIPFAVAKGYRESFFVHAENNARSTKEEAAAVIPMLRRDGMKTVLLVTSNYHTRRAWKTFQGAAPDLTFIAVAAPDEFFRPDNWWRIRDARKIFLFEWEKTVASWLGM